MAVCDAPALPPDPSPSARRPQQVPKRSEALFYVLLVMVLGGLRAAEEHRS